MPLSHCSHLRHVKPSRFAGHNFTRFPCLHILVCDNFLTRVGDHCDGSNGRRWYVGSRSAHVYYWRNGGLLHIGKISYSIQMSKLVMRILIEVNNLLNWKVKAGSMSGMCISFNAWAMKKRGPVMVSIFNPLGTVISALFSVLTLGESIHIGR